MSLLLYVAAFVSLMREVSRFSQGDEMKARRNRRRFAMWKATARNRPFTVQLCTSTCSIVRSIRLRREGKVSVALALPSPSFRDDSLANVFFAASRCADFLVSDANLAASSAIFRERRR